MSNNGGKKIELKETREFYEFLLKLIRSIADAKTDDGKISTSEWITMAITTTPAAARGFMGIGTAWDEVKKLNEAEMEQLAAMGVELMKEASRFFLKNEGGR